MYISGVYVGVDPFFEYCGEFRDRKSSGFRHEDEEAGLSDDADRREEE